MRHRGRGWLAIVAAMAAACATRLPSGPTAGLPPGAGLLYLYLEPLPPEADGLRAEISSVAAVSADGTELPLRLESRDLDATTPRRQRLLALGALPAGAYRGLVVAAAWARLDRAPAPLELSSGPAPAQSEAPFTVAAGRASVLRLGLRGEAVTAASAAFEPTFTVGPASATHLAPGATAVATVPGSSSLVVFHKMTGEVFDVLRTSDSPRGVAYDKATARAYVACAGADVVESFDLARGVRDQSLPLLLGDGPTGLALSRDGRTVVVTNPGSNTVSVLDAPSLGERFRVTVGLDPVATLFDADERGALVFQRGGNAVALVDLARGALVATIPTDPGPVFGALLRSGRRLLVIHGDSSYLSLVDLAALRVERRAYIGPGATAIAVDPRTDRAYIARRGGAAIEVFDPTALLPIETVATPGDPTFLFADREAEQLWAAIPAARAVQAIRLSGGRVTATVELGGAAAWIDAAGGDGRGP